MAITTEQLEAMTPEQRKAAGAYLDALRKALRDESQSWLEGVGCDVLHIADGIDAEGEAFCVIKFTHDSRNAGQDGLEESHSVLADAMAAAVAAGVEGTIEDAE